MTKLKRHWTTHLLISKVLLITLCLFYVSQALSKQKEPPVYECIRWTWFGDVYNRKVVCLEWKEKDCSNRLYKNICKVEK
jgi:hypothetical protein